MNTQRAANLANFAHQGIGQTASMVPVSGAGFAWIMCASLTQDMTGLKG